MIRNEAVHFIKNLKGRESVSGLLPLLVQNTQNLTGNENTLMKKDMVFLL